MTAPLGYQADFLGIHVALPTPVGDVRVVDLEYPRFSVRLDTRRRLARVTGVNIDGARLQDLERSGQWRLDTRVAASAQAGPDIYAGNDLDRGHLVRRRDPGWGSVAEARAATEATFVYPNAAPQASVFNQSKQLWLGLEDHVLRFADSTDIRVSVFTAPVLDDDDPPYRGIGVPRRFWKVAAWSSADAPRELALAAAGFVLDQSDLIDTREGVVTVRPLGAFRTFQVGIADIERLAGVDAGALATADVLAPVSARGDAGWRALRTMTDIVLG